MNKKIIATISVIGLAIVLGIGIYQSDAAKSEPELTYDDVKQIAESQYPGTITEIELEKKNGHVFYDIEMHNDDKQYELEIDAKTGDILELQEKTKHKQKQSSNEHKNEGKTFETNDSELLIEMTTAIDIALGEFPGTVTEAELDENDGRIVYEVEIDSQGRKVEVEIDAKTSEILIIEIDD